MQLLMFLKFMFHNCVPRDHTETKCVGGLHGEFFLEISKNSI